MPDELRNRMVVPRVVWLAMLASTWIYGLVAVLVTGAIATGDHPPAPAPTGLLIALGAAALAILVATPIVRAAIMPPRERVGDGAPIDLGARLDAPAGRAALMKAFRLWILSWALSEAVAILGLVAVLLRHDAVEYVPFAVAADVAMLAYAPRAALLEQILRAHDEHRPT